MTNRTNPYPGAKPLTADDPTLLHGRDLLLAEFRRLLQRYPVIEVAGPSGVGKSSFIGAGLCGRLDQESRLVIRAFSAWSQLPDTAGTVFYAEALKAALRNGSGGAQARIDEFLHDPKLVSTEEDPFAFVQAVNTAFGQDLVVVYDQLEELLRDDPHLGRRFLANVRDIAAALPDGFTQVVSLREEYVTHLKIIEESLDTSLWQLKLITEVGSEVVSKMVTSPLERSDIDVEVDDDLIKAIDETWLLARPDMRSSSRREVADESRPGLLHLQGFLYTMFAQLDPAPGTRITSEQVAEVLGIRWPSTQEDAMAFFAEGLERYVELELERRFRELVVDGRDLRLRQFADETKRIAAALPEHLSSAGYKLVRGTDGLAATVLTQLRDLHRQLDKDQRTDEAAACDAGAPQFPPGMAEGSDIGQQVKSLAQALARRCRQDHGQEHPLDAAELAAAAVAEFPGLMTWGDNEMAAGRMYRPMTDIGEDEPSPALMTACELVVTYERALRWLEKSCIIRMTPSRTGERMAAIVHDGFGTALTNWAARALDDPRVEVALPVAVTGKQVFYRPMTDDRYALDREVLPRTEGLGWIGCNVTAFFDRLVFRSCDLRSTLFVNCRFREVVFEDCVTHGLLFIDCKFQGGITIRSTGSDHAREGAKELKTITFGRGCVVEDRALRFEGLGGYGVFLDDFVGAWEVAACTFSHLVVSGYRACGEDEAGGDPGSGAGPGRIVDSPSLSHVVVKGWHPHPLEIWGSRGRRVPGQEAPKLDAPAHLQAASVNITYHPA